MKAKTLVCYFQK